VSTCTGIGKDENVCEVADSQYDRLAGKCERKKVDSIRNPGFHGKPQKNSVKLHKVSLPPSERIGLLKQLRKLILPLLQVRVATNMLLVDEDAGHGALVCHFLKRFLDRTAII